jgi:hypothetical protein
LLRKSEVIKNDNLIPIVIGVTGHRDLRDEDRRGLEDQVRSIFTDLKKDYPNTPLVLLSPLAEGADRLVAEVALSCGARLIVPLPMEQGEYEKDFKSKESKAEFKELLKKADQKFVLPLVEDNTPVNIQLQGENRDKQYIQVGAYIARRSQILIALWNGINTDLAAGTAQVVNFKRKGIPVPYGPPVNQLEPVDVGPVYHVVTPRIKIPELEGTVFSLNKLFPLGWEGKSKEEAENAYKQILNRIDTFNRDVCRIGSTKEMAFSKSYVISKEKDLPPSSKTILEHYAIADSMAMYFQRITRKTFFSLFIIAVLAVLFFELYAHFPLEDKPIILLACYPFFLGLAFCLYVLAKKWEWQHKYLDYRALAEGLRVQFFWSLSGFSNEEVSRHYLQKQKSELDWIRNAISSWNIGSDQPNLIERTNSEVRRQNYKLVLNHWVLDQLKFYKKRTERDHKKHDLHEHWFRNFILIGLGLAVVVVVVDLFHGIEKTLLHFLIIIMGFTPAVAAALAGYAGKMAFSAQAKQYQRMDAVFSRAAQFLEEFLKEDDLDGAQKLIKNLGIEALDENGDWVVLHRERPIEMPVGG